MRITNPLQMNDWKIKNFLKVVLTIQLAMWSAIGLDVMGLQIPIVRQSIGFIYLTFLPGILIIRILKLHKLGDIETLLYTVGLSIATLMFTGFFMNMVYPFFGISEPISITPIITTMSVVVLCLCYASYKRDKDFSDPDFIGIKDALSPPVLFLCLIPFLAVLGTYLLNFYDDNRLLMLLIIILAVISVSIGFDKIIQKKLYPLTVFMIAISLLYHKSLVSMYLWGTDIHLEQHLCNLVMWDSYWDSTISETVNAMLSIVMLAPIFSDICNMPSVWVFKVIYPLIFALVPLGLYRVFQKQTDDKIAFLSCFFFMAVGPFYIIMLWVARQQIAELFFVLLILLMVNRDIDRMKRSFLLCIFGFSLVVSHYGVSYIYMFGIIFAWLILYLMENPAIQKSINGFRCKFNQYWAVGYTSDSITSENMGNKTISSAFVRLFVVFALTWYIYVSGATVFNTIVNIGEQVINNIADMFKPDDVEALHMLFGVTVSPLHNVNKYLHILTQFFIFIGIVALLLKHPGIKFEKEYSVFSLIFFGIFFASLAIPYTSVQLGATRAYLLFLFFLAPFCAIGCIVTSSVLSRVIRGSWKYQSTANPLKVLSVLLAILLLFNTGLVYEIANDVPEPTAISLNTTLKHPRFQFNEQEAYGAQWLANTAEKGSYIYAGDFGRFILWDFVSNKDKVRVFYNNTQWVPRNTYIYMGLLNARVDEVVVLDVSAKGYSRTYPKLSNSTFYHEIVIHSDKIYDNVDAQVYDHSY